MYRKTIIKQGTIWNPDTFGRFGESSPVPVVCFGAGRYSLTTDYDCKHSDKPALRQPKSVSATTAATTATLWHCGTVTATLRLRQRLHDCDTVTATATLRHCDCDTATATGGKQAACRYVTYH